MEPSRTCSDQLRNIGQTQQRPSPPEQASAGSRIGRDGLPRHDRLGQPYDVAATSSLTRSLIKKTCGSK